METASIPRLSFTWFYSESLLILGHRGNVHRHYRASAMTAQGLMWCKCCNNSFINELWVLTEGQWENTGLFPIMHNLYSLAWLLQHVFNSRIAEKHPLKTEESPVLSLNKAQTCVVETAFSTAWGPLYMHFRQLYTGKKKTGSHSAMSLIEEQISPPQHPPLPFDSVNIQHQRRLWVQGAPHWSAVEQDPDPASWGC